MFLKKSSFFFVEDIDLFVTRNVATFKNIGLIPIICEIRKNKDGHVAIMLFEVKPT
jgi:hypothetical protein